MVQKSVTQDDHPNQDDDFFIGRLGNGLHTHCFVKRGEVIKTSSENEYVV